MNEKYQSDKLYLVENFEKTEKLVYNRSVVERK
ncbi:hypothetical protein DAD63_02135 [Streptococcus agalactiae]|jgi:hypothetical protein|uniref:Uncharacterized protein n=4 Tax=Streptococcus agalactiae TaxID=1311 RepID=Q8DY75_STRA5|nr:hypothetical protein SAG1617 [Streptococcus agalactiae 2603V/R]ABA45422.1 hypothetical protein SAK_1632 [Streptococcus agalactiae A909]AKI95963.1 Hypothetical protein RDF_1548 [Streptococcus agalactiae]ARC25360.1 hypothetical protein A6J68_09525 [Streptococcus sp. 'group B']AYY65235.1 hypothetical protein EGX70_10700 [Streptococcus sp. FDAARGOS_522]AYY68198.1 hypothetical protein EGX72_04020 [Streptococcus sp. FDAARGOS_521]AYZ04110.1 hypothetical protein EGX96_02245 [Streptococcus sp. FDAA